MVNPYAIFFVPLIILFYPVIIWVFVIVYKRCKRKRTFYYLLLTFAIGYVGLYVPSLIAYWQFVSWKSDKTTFEKSAAFDQTNIFGVYLPHLDCGQLCKELLLRTNLEFVETKAEAVESVSGKHLASKKTYARWRLIRSKNICWAQTGEYLPRMNVEGDRSLLAQGICFLPELTDTLQAPLQIFGKSNQKFTSGRWKYLIEETYVYKGFLIKGKFRAPAFKANYKAVSLRAFPLMLSIKPGQIFATTTAQFGRKITLKEVFDRLDIFKRTIVISSSGYFFLDTSAKQIEEVAKSANPMVRWSAAYALCMLEAKNPGKYKRQIMALRNDVNRWVAAAAQTPNLGHRGTNVCSGGYLNGQFLKGGYFDE
jgi:hypothetical protein